MPDLDPSRASARITLRNLIIARWVLITLVSASVLLTVVVGEHLPAGLLPESPHHGAVLGALVVWVGLNLSSTLALKRDLASELVAGSHLLVDALALTVLLGLSGGAANPFTMLYFLPITLATQVSPRWTWILAGVSVLGFAALFVLAPASAPTPAATAAGPAMDHAAMDHAAMDHAAMDHADGQGAAAPPQGSGHEAHFEGHQRGMWVAFGIVGVLITVFVHRTALALARERDELARLRRGALEDRHLTAVGALAAGAAHELGTPLATIKVLAGELPHLDASELGEAQAGMNEALDRCKLILASMASPELRISATPTGRAWRVGELVDAISQAPCAVSFTTQAGALARARRSRQPFEVLAQLLRELVHNGAEACRQAGAGTGAQSGRGVELRVAIDEGAKARGPRLRVEVADSGVGMDAAAVAAAFDPFHSTRPEGEGLGLGLYLARAHLRQLGGSIRLDSARGRGTTAIVELPLLEPQEAG